MNRSDIQEQLATLYLRLNGYFTSGFIVHAPRAEYNDAGELRRNRSELDVLAVRFPHNAEPEREVGPSPFLDVSSEFIDILICEVKGGTNKAPQFNSGLRQNPNSVRSVLRWVGLYDDEQIVKLIPPVIKILATQNPNDHESYREYIPSEEINRGLKTRIRAILFAPDRPPSQRGQTKFIHGEEMIDYIWLCLQPDKPRLNCETRYDFGLWSGHEQLVRFFKTTEHKPAEIRNVYAALDVQ